MIEINKKIELILLKKKNILALKALLILNRNLLLCMYGHNQTTRNKPTTVFIGMRPHLLHFL